MAHEKEFKTSGEPLDQDKIGTKVTWHGQETDPDVAVIYGVPMKKGQSVDLAEHMEEDRAKTYASKLARNPDFEAEGAPRAKPRKASAGTDPSLAAAGTQVGTAFNEARARGEEPPEGYDAPLTARLENQPKGQSEQERKQAETDAKLAQERDQEGDKSRSQQRPNLPKGK